MLASQQTSTALNMSEPRRAGPGPGMGGPRHRPAWAVVSHWSLVRRRISLERLGLCVTVTPMVESPFSEGASDPGDNRNGPASMPLRTPICETRPGPWGQRAQVCLCCVFSLEPSPASGLHPPWRTQQWGLSQGLRGGSGTQVTDPRAQARGAWSNDLKPGHSVPVWG